jgi:hypothetical protein
MSHQYSEQWTYTMSTKEAYKQRIDAELDLVEEKFARFKARGMALTADTQIKHAVYVKELEQKLHATKPS